MEDDVLKGCGLLERVVWRWMAGDDDDEWLCGDSFLFVVNAFGYLDLGSSVPLCCHVGYVRRVMSSDVQPYNITLTACQSYQISNLLIASIDIPYTGETTERLAFHPGERHVHGAGTVQIPVPASYIPRAPLPEVERTMYILFPTDKR